MAKEELFTNVILINQKVKFTGKAKNNPEITIDYNPPVGDGEGYTSLELLLISLSTCIGTSVISLLRKMRKNIQGLKVNAKGIRRDQHPTSFENITVELIINSNDTQEADVQKAIQLSEESICPVWAMLKNNVEIDVIFKVIEGTEF